MLGHQHTVSNVSERLFSQPFTFYEENKTENRVKDNIWMTLKVLKTTPKLSY